MATLVSERFAGTDRLQVNYVFGDKLSPKKFNMFSLVSSCLSTFVCYSSPEH
jgi:hypothetical protein